MFQTACCDHLSYNAAACNGEYADYTTTNNCSQGLDLRSTSRREDQLPVSSSTRVLPPAAVHRSPVMMEVDEKRDTKLPLDLGSSRIAREDKDKYVAQWCEDQREYTHASCVNMEVGYRKPKNEKMSTRDKLIKRITHPFTRGDKKRLEEAIGEVAGQPTPTRRTLTDVQHSDFVQGRHCVGFSI